MLASVSDPHLEALEAEAVFIMREVAEEFLRPVLLFSGGKDSVVLLRLAEKALRPDPFPFAILHVDTGHNFPEVLAFRDRRVAELGERLIVAAGALVHGRVDEDLAERQLLDAVDVPHGGAILGVGEASDAIATTPASARSAATWPTRRRFSCRAARSKPRSPVRPWRRLSPSST
jgi:phosphoadenosine phosphosulfate reductase family protein